MSDNHQSPQDQSGEHENNPVQPGQTSAAAGYFSPGAENVKAVYISYLVSILVPFVVLIGIVMAYLNRGKSDAWIESHYTFQIRTFWIALLFSVISAILMIVGIGFILMIGTAVWAIVRIVKGLQSISKNEAIANPQTWLW